MRSFHLVATILHIKQEGVRCCCEQLLHLGRSEDVCCTNDAFSLSDEGQKAGRPLLEEVEDRGGGGGADSRSGDELCHQWAAAGRRDLA